MAHLSCVQNGNEYVFNDNSKHNYIINEELKNGDWVNSLSKLTYLDQRGVPRTWEGESRLGNTETIKEADVVGVIAFYKRQLHFDCIILVKQYRPALNAFTIELPSGTVEGTECPAETAIREMLECTGFTGVCKKVGPVLAMDSSTSSSSMRIVTLEINGDDLMNTQMDTMGGNDRFKEPVVIPVSELLDKLSSYSSAGFLVDSRLDAFAVGLAMGTSGTKTKVPTTLV